MSYRRQGTKNFTLPEEFYRDWNLEDELVAELDEWSLLRITSKEVPCFLYKTLENVIEIDGIPAWEIRWHFLYKGKLFQMYWQNDSLLAYLKPHHYGGNPNFIISFREYKGEKVALVQRDRKGHRKG